MSLLVKQKENNIHFIAEITIASVCRICLENEANIPLFETNSEDEPDIQSKLSVCLKEKIEDIEGYPRFICKVCSNILDSAYKFIQKYKETCKILKTGLNIIKHENVTLDNGNFEEEIEISNIKHEFDHFFSDDDLSDDDKEFFEPLHKIKLKVEKETKIGIKKRIKTPKTINRLVTNKIASSILEGQFTWNGEKWCLKTNLPAAKEKSKQLQSKPVKRQTIKIELPKGEKSNPQKLCDLCGEVCKDRDQLDKHKRKVHFRKSIGCPHCTKVLCSTYYLSRHIKRKHSEKKEFICTVCGSKFAFKGELQSHNKNVHEKHLRPRKQYKCKFCTKSYKCAKSVQVHERSAHTGHRPAVCDVCDSSFYHIDYLKEHMRLHTGETPFKCPICGRGYAQRCNMKSHLRIHRISELDAATLSKLRPNYLRLLKA